MEALALLIICVLLLAYGCVYAALARARERPIAVFRHVGLIVQQNLPLTPALRLAAQSERGALQRILSQTAVLVEAGAPLADALQLAYPRCPAMPLSVVQAAQRMGTLPAAIRELNRRLAEQRPRALSEAGSRLAYLFVVVLVYLGVLLAITTFVTPKFREIFSDFRAAPPLLASEVVAAMPLSSVGPTTTAGSLLRALVLLVATLAPLMFLWSFLRLLQRRMDRTRLISALLDMVQWHAWPLRTIAVCDGCRDAIPVLRLAAAAGWTLPDAIQFASEVDANRHWRLRMQDWARRTRAGEEAVAAGRVAGMPDMLLRHVAIGVRDGDLDAPLHQAEAYYAAIVHRWRALLAHLVGPVLTLVMGLIVGSVCLAIFESLKALIDHCCMLIG